MSIFLVKIQMPQLHINRNAWDAFFKHTSVYHRDYHISKRDFFPKFVAQSLV